MAESDPFEAVFLSEERAHQLGFQEGQSYGKESGLIDGFRTGYHKGWEIGEEIGFYLGFSETWLKLLTEGSQDNERKIKTLSAFVDTLKDFAIMNVHEEMYTENLQNIRCKYRQIKSLLKLSTETEQITKTLNF